MDIERAKELFKMRIETEEYSGMTTNTLKEAMKIVLSELEKKDEYIKMLTDERDTLIQERDYYKARYNEFNNAFIEGGKKLCERSTNE